MVTTRQMCSKSNETSLTEIRKAAAKKRWEYDNHMKQVNKKQDWQERKNSSQSKINVKPKPKSSVKVAYLTEAIAFPADKNWTHISGVQHICARNVDGELFAVGKNLDNALGLGTWTDNKDVDHWRYDTLQRVHLHDLEAAGVSASLGTTIAWMAETGQVFGFGYDAVGQLGLNRVEDDEKMVPLPTEIKRLQGCGCVYCRQSCSLPSYKWRTFRRQM